MKYLCHIALALVITAAFVNNTTGQMFHTADAVVPRENDIVLPPLADLIDSALKHNATVRFRSQEVNAKEYNLKSQQNYWTRNLGIQADSRYGTFDNYSSSASGQSTTILASTSRQLNYGMGAYIKFPIGDIIDRKNLVGKAKVELEQAKSMAEAQQDEIRQLVIHQYEDLLLKQRLLRIRAQAFGNARVNSEMVETQFRNGIIPVSEYVRISDIVSRVESDYETAKTDYTTAKMILEDIVGFIFTPAAKRNENN
jgi:outer membrane protein TolC